MGPANVDVWRGFAMLRGLTEIITEASDTLHAIQREPFSSAYFFSLRFPRYNQSCTQGE
jgi:hypothetical protein